MLDSSDSLPDTCALEHRFFRVMQGLFRRSESDGAPVMVIDLGARDATVPIASLRTEFELGDDTADGRMLALVASALDYVSVLRIGDKLPREVLDGGASWEPEERHRAVAQARLRRGLVMWLEGEAANKANPTMEAMQRLESDQGLRERVTRALGEAARTLELPGATDVLALIEALGEELSYIEALRERLLRPVQELVRRFARLGDTQRGDVDHMATLMQVRRLGEVGLRQIALRFDEIDAQTGEVLSVLRNADRQREFIRKNRDWLYCTLRGWEPVLRDWAQGEDPGAELSLRAVIGRTYQFLAPRYMPVQEWHAKVIDSAARGARKMKDARQW